MSKTESDQKRRVLCVGFDPAQFLASELKNVECEKIDYNVDVLLELSDSPPLMVLCGTPPAELPASEAAQLLRSKYPDIAIYLLVGADQRYNRKDVIKNGFTDLFFIPVDTQTAREAVQAYISKELQEGRVFRSVKVVDIQADSELDFDTFVYLPSNNKHIKFSKAGQKMESAKIERLQKHKASSLFVDQTDIKKFYTYTAKALKALGSNSTMGQTEKNEKLKETVREVVTDLFSDKVIGTDTGKKIVEDCQEIVRSYVLESKVGKIYDKLLAQRTESTDTYAHYTNVATYASMFAIGLGFKTVEEIALAGLLHDLGLTRIPYEIQAKKEAAMTPEEKAIYVNHVEYSIAIMQERKLVLPDLVYKIVLQHHERFNGKGYPKAMPGDRICKEAQVLAFADMLDYMTAPVKGAVQPTPVAVAKWFRSLLAKPDECPIEPALLKSILQFFPLD